MSKGKSEKRTQKHRTRHKSPCCIAASCINTIPVNKLLFALAHRLRLRLRLRHIVQIQAVFFIIVCSACSGFCLSNNNIAQCLKHAPWRMRNVHPSLEGFCVLTVVIIAPAFLIYHTYVCHCVLKQLFHFLFSPFICSSLSLLISTVCGL